MKMQKKRDRREEKKGSSSFKIRLANYTSSYKIQPCVIQDKKRGEVKPGKGKG